MKDCRSFFFCLLYLLVANFSFSASYTWNGGSGNWNVDANWSGSGIPGSTDDIDIPAGSTIVIPSGYTAQCGYLVINSDFANGDITIALTDATSSFAISDDGDIQTATTHTQDNVITIDLNGGTLSFAGTMRLAGKDVGAYYTKSKIIADGGTITAGGEFYFSRSGSGDAEALVDLSNGGTFKIGDAITMQGSGTGAQINCGTTGIVEYFKAGAQTIYNDLGGTAITYNDLTLSGSGTKSLQGSIDVDGDITIGGSTVLDVANNAYDINLAGDFTESSSDSDPFIQRSADVTLDGSTKQTLSGDALNFNNLIIENSTKAEAVQIDNNVTLSGNLTLKDGHVVGNPSTNWIKCTQPGGMVHSPTEASDSTFLKCTYRHTTLGLSMNYLYVYVGGNNRLKHLKMDPYNTTAAIDCDFRYTAGDAADLGYTMPGTIDKVSPVGYWTIEPSVPANASGYFYFYYTQDDGVSDASDLRIVKDDGAGSWVNMGGTGSGTPTGYIENTTEITSWSDFALANTNGGSNPLPVELLSFQATNQEDQVDVSWSTATETNSDYFTVERSVNGIDFDFIAQVKAAGTSSLLKQYTSVDTDPLGGLSYYRLSQTDYDGMVHFYAPVPIERGIEMQMKLMRNPVSFGEIPYLSFNQEYIEHNKELLVVVYDMNGRETYSKINVIGMTTKGLIAIDPQRKLSPGIYTIVAAAENQVHRYKLVVR